ncbi:hypothetical protein JA1_005095 [Spathaspora sp. JA1]|nr:hypothetical protein JA1_005095 [Spathaspora sp. JA1]
MSRGLFLENRNADLAKRILFEEAQRLNIHSSLVFQQTPDPTNPMSSILSKNPRKVVRLQFDKNLILMSGNRGFGNHIFLAAKILQTPYTDDFFKSVDSRIVHRLVTECGAQIEPFSSAFEDQVQHISILQGVATKRAFSETSCRQVKDQLEQIDVSDLIGDINIDLESITLDTGASKVLVREKFFPNV